MDDPRHDPSVDASGDRPETVECPYCGSTDTVNEHPKGPSLCRSLYFCTDCGEPFERFG